MCEARLKLRRLSTLGTCTTNAHTSKRIRTHTHAQFYTQTSIYAYMCIFYTYNLLKVRPYRRFVSFRFGFEQGQCMQMRKGYVILTI